MNETQTTLRDLRDRRDEARRAYEEGVEAHPGTDSTHRLYEAYKAAHEAFYEAHELAVDKSIARYSMDVVATVAVPLTDHHRSVVLRCDDGTDLILSLIVAGDHLSVDVTAYRGAEDAPIRAFAMGDPPGVQTQRIAGPLLVAMIDHEDAE